ncbi:Peptide-methionine (S)-S-oxide reductase MsrA [Staphylococcus aureus]|nr:Peptide-methionine (S)-S-oxide reductase MsrA [Staphylococcus aureus]
MTKEYATLAGGCFWCMVKIYNIRHQVSRICYSGGHVDNQLMNRYVRIKPAMSKQYKLRLIQRLLPLKIY